MEISSKSKEVIERRIVQLFKANDKYHEGKHNAAATESMRWAVFAKQALGELGYESEIQAGSIKLCNHGKLGEESIVKIFDADMTYDEFKVNFVARRVLPEHHCWAFCACLGEHGTIVDASLPSLFYEAGLKPHDTGTGWFTPSTLPDGYGYKAEHNATVMVRAVEHLLNFGAMPYVKPKTNPEDEDAPPSKQRKSGAYRHTQQSKD